MEPEGVPVDALTLKPENSGRVTTNSTKLWQKDYNCRSFSLFNGPVASTPIKPINTDESSNLNLEKIDENQNFETFNFSSVETEGTAPKDVLSSSRPMANGMDGSKLSLGKPDSTSFITDCTINNNTADRRQFFCYNRTGEIMFMDTSSPPLECIDRMINNFRGYSKTPFKSSSNQTFEAFFTAASFKTSASVDYKPSENAENCRPSTSSAVLLSATPLTSKGHVLDTVPEHFNQPAFDFCTPQSQHDSSVGFCKSPAHGSITESNENETACIINSNELTFNDLEKTCAHDIGTHQTDEENEVALSLNVNEVTHDNPEDLNRSSKSFHEDGDEEVTRTNNASVDEDVSVGLTATESPMIIVDTDNCRSLNVSGSNRKHLPNDDPNCRGDDGVKQSRYRFSAEQNCQPSCSRIPEIFVANIHASSKDTNTSLQQSQKETEMDFSDLRVESFMSSVMNISSISPISSVTEKLNEEFGASKDDSRLPTPIFTIQEVPVPLIRVPTASSSACPNGTSKIPVVRKSNCGARRKSIHVGKPRALQSSIQPFKFKSGLLSSQRTDGSRRMLQRSVRLSALKVSTVTKRVVTNTENDNNQPSTSAATKRNPRKSTNLRKSKVFRAAEAEVVDQEAPKPHGTSKIPVLCKTNRSPRRKSIHAGKPRALQSSIQPFKFKSGLLSSRRMDGSRRMLRRSVRLSALKVPTVTKTVITNPENDNDQPSASAATTRNPRKSSNLRKSKVLKATEAEVVDQEEPKPSTSKCLNSNAAPKPNTSATKKRNLRISTNFGKPKVIRAAEAEVIDQEAPKPRTSKRLNSTAAPIPKKVPRVAKPEVTDQDARKPITNVSSRSTVNSIERGGAAVFGQPSSTAVKAQGKNAVKKTVAVHDCCSRASKLDVPPLANSKTVLKPQSGKR